MSEGTVSAILVAIVGLIVCVAMVLSYLEKKDEKDRAAYAPKIQQQAPSK